MGAVNFFYNDLYPNMGATNTRNQTVPEAEDRNALAEEGKSVDNATVTPAKKNKIFLYLGVFLGIVVLLGVLK